MKALTLVKTGALMELLSLLIINAFGQTTSTRTGADSNTARSNIVGRIAATRIARAQAPFADIYSISITVPFDIYPPGYLDRLQKIADGTLVEHATWLDDPSANQVTIRTFRRCF